MKPFVLFCLVFMLVGCGSPGVATPAPTPQTIQVIYPPSLKPWADQLGSCAAKNPLVAAYFTESPSIPSILQTGEIYLSLGQIAENTLSAYLSQAGTEQIALIVNQSNKLSHLSTGELTQIFSGQQVNWADSSLLIQVWTLPIGDSAEKVFIQAVLPAGDISTQAKLAPDPAAMLEAISKDENAIGYVPGSYLVTGDNTILSKIKSISLDDALITALRQPVIAATAAEPQGLLRDVLICLQINKP